MKTVAKIADIPQTAMPLLHGPEFVSQTIVIVCAFATFSGKKVAQARRRGKQKYNAMITKITIFQMRHWEKENPQTGDTIEKFYYAGFPEKGKPFEFSTDRSDIEIQGGVLKFDPDRCEEIDLESVFDSFKGVMKMREVGSAGK